MGTLISLLGLVILINWATGNDTDHNFWYGVALCPLGMIEACFGIYVMKRRRTR